MAAHSGEVVRLAGGHHGYPFRATCCCGWQSPGYVAEHAARAMLAAHAAEPVNV